MPPDPLFINVRGVLIPTHSLDKGISVTASFSSQITSRNNAWA